MWQLGRAGCFATRQSTANEGSVTALSCRATVFAVICVISTSFLPYVMMPSSRSVMRSYEVCTCCTREIIVALHITSVHTCHARIASHTDCCFCLSLTPCTLFVLSAFSAKERARCASAKVYSSSLFNHTQAQCTSHTVRTSQHLYAWHSNSLNVCDDTQAQCTLGWRHSRRFEAST